MVVDPGLQAYIDPLTPEEHDALERSLLAEGCRDALVLWGDVLVDGHNRHRICVRHGLPFETVQNPRFRSLEDVHLWMIDQHLGRRSVSDFQRGVLALRQREIVAARRAQADPAPPAGADAAPDAPRTDAGSDAAPAPLATREAVARAARLSSGQMGMIEKIQKQAAPEVVAAVRAGSLSINAAAAVASLPPEEQAAAAGAGPEELRRAAKRVREARRKPAAEAPPADGGMPPEAAPPGDELAALRRRVAELTAENADLRRQLAAR
ncbi:MAG: plasmid replication/partition related protein [Xylophilus ampelinus]